MTVDKARLTSNSQLVKSACLRQLSSSCAIGTVIVWHKSWGCCLLDAFDQIEIGKRAAVFVDV